MEIRFNVTGAERKAFVTAVSEIAGWEAVYKKAPTFAYVVHNYTIDKNGTLTFDERVDAEDARSLLAELAGRGFVSEIPVAMEDPASDAAVQEMPAGDGSYADAYADGSSVECSFVGDSSEAELSAGDVTAESSPDVHLEVLSEENAPTETIPSEDASAGDDPDRLVIEVPLEGFSNTALYNLEKLVASKAALIMKSIGLSQSGEAEVLPIVREDDSLCFPWFKLGTSLEETHAYTQLVHALCEMAKKQKRVVAKEKPADSEKYAFRCFLLRLGFIGDEYATARKILLSNLSGNGSFKSGDHKRETAPEAVTIADSGGENAEAVSIREDGQDADNAPTGGQEAVAPPRCGECRHHHYYTDGLLRTSTGDIVDTSKRTPDKYTHYCLGAPSGFRKIKNAADWSGLEVPPSWCPQHTMSNNGPTGGEEMADA